MRKVSILLCLTLLLLMTGCTVSRETRISEIKSQYPQWDQITVERVADGKVVPGMTEEMVRKALGDPWFIERDGQSTVWTFGSFGPDSHGTTDQILTHVITFKDKKVTEVKEVHQY